MAAEWLETVASAVATAAKDAPVVAGGGLAWYGYPVAPLFNSVILVAVALWAIVRLVTICLELKWKWEDRKNGKGK